MISYPELMARGEDWNGLVNWELHLQTKPFLPQQSRSTQPKLQIVLQSTCPPYHHSWKGLQGTWTPSLGGRNSVPTSREQSTIIWQSTMNSELEVLTLIPTTSPSAANRPSACWRLRSNEARKPHHWQKAEMESWGHQTSISQLSRWFPYNW